MASPDIISICISALVAVFTILSLLAAVMKLVVILFPEKSSNYDQAVAASIAATVAANIPGMTVTKIEEIK